MKERPILFNDEMVRAVLDGRKTQTRRVVQPDGAVHITPFIGADNLPTWEFGWCPYPSLITKHIRCPFGQPGDRLWVRECWSEMFTDGIGEHLVYRADGEQDKQWLSYGRWKPSIHMPRWASRITLEITSVRVERLQDISRQDAKAEGFLPGLNGLESWDGRLYGNAELAFQACWQSIYGAESWDANPWVWAVEFRRLECQA